MKVIFLLFACLACALPAIAQALSAPSFIGETIWGCSSFSATKRWTRVSGADSYEVRIDSGSWTNVGSSTRHRFSLRGKTTTRLRVRAVANGESGPSSSVTVRQNSLRSSCDIDDTNTTSAGSGSGSGGGGADDDDAPGGAFAQHVKPLVQTCLELPESIVVSGTVKGTQCQQVTERGIGIAALITQGVLGAVDVWGIVEAGLQVCFRGQGGLKFLDAATAPRAVSDLPAQASNGTTCAILDRAGTVVLMRGTGPSPDAIASPSQAAPAAASASAESIATTETQPQAAMSTGNGGSAGGAGHTGHTGRALVDCPVTTSDILNLRQGPGLQFAIILEIPYQTRLTASARAGEWYQVEYGGDAGWISANLVSRHGTCAWA